MTDLPPPDPVLALIAAINDTPAASVGFKVTGLYQLPRGGWQCSLYTFEYGTVSALGDSVVETLTLALAEARAAVSAAPKTQAIASAEDLGL